MKLTAEPPMDESSGAVKARRLGLGFWLPTGWMILIVGVALLAPVLPLKDPTDYFIRPGERPPYPPSADHWFGTDQDARDMFSRIIRDRKSVV